MVSAWQTRKARGVADGIQHARAKAEAILPDTDQCLKRSRTWRAVHGCSQSIRYPTEAVEISPNLSALLSKRIAGSIGGTRTKRHRHLPPAVRGFTEASIATPFLGARCDTSMNSLTDSHSRARLRSRLESICKNRIASFICTEVDHAVEITRVAVEITHRQTAVWREQPDSEQRRAGREMVVRA